MSKAEMDADRFLELILDEAASQRRSERKLGTIPSTYGGTGRPTVIFDGEDSASTKAYPYLSSYTPAADDRVALVKFGHTWLIIGAIV